MTQWKVVSFAAYVVYFFLCWVGTETRDANPEPIQACWIMAWINEITAGRCGGGWYDALDCMPEKYVEQAYCTILGGAKESLVHGSVRRRLEENLSVTGSGS